MEAARKPGSTSHGRGSSGSQGRSCGQLGLNVLCSCSSSSACSDLSAAASSALSINNSVPCVNAMGLDNKGDNDDDGDYDDNASEDGDDNDNNAVVLVGAYDPAEDEN